jgi:hypothetical protein
MAFKLSKAQSAERDALAADLRKKADALNIAIVAFNQAIEPVSQAVGEALEGYNGILEKARDLASSITERAQEQFDAKSEKWQESDKGIEVRCWIEQWEMSFDDVDLELPEPLTEIDPDEQAGEIEAAPPNAPGVSRCANQDMTLAAGGAGRGRHCRVTGSGTDRDGFAHAFHRGSLRGPVKSAGRGLCPKWFGYRCFF